MSDGADKSCSHCSGQFSSPSVHQTLDELDFERGIWTAALNGDLTDVEKHLNKDGNCDICDTSGYTALHYASRNGHKDVCELLLKRGSNPNARTKSGGVTSLHRAAFKGHEDIIKLLLKHGADPSIQDTDGKTALHKAVEGKHQSLVKLILSSYPECINVRDNRDQLPVDCASPKDEAMIKELTNT